MRGLIKAIIAVMLFAALYVPCNASDIGLERQNVGPNASIAYQNSVEAARHHTKGGESRSGNHCQPDGLFVAFSTQRADDDETALFVPESTRAFPGQQLSVAQRPPIL
ncbi:hypothetical protein [Rhizobium sp. PL01]|uniref:hypothetical protein n=1 Tax=Rhizobium sp. PL01 TaxID=3085631 RepID=UPI002981C186|nr:hypothetical protein [Rhizobium sp. PL01]MDW5317652.1 hypothetical protein [Rhizobium sp. PL01]